MTIITTISGLQFIQILKEGDTANSVIVTWKVSTIVLLAIEVLKIIGLVALIVWHIII